MEKLVHRAVKRLRYNELTDGKNTDRLGTGGQQETKGGCKACMNAITTQKSEHLEQPRTYRFTRHDYPYGMDGKGKPGGRVKVLESTMRATFEWTLRAAREEAHERKRATLVG